MGIVLDWKVSLANQIEVLKTTTVVYHKPCDRSTSNSARASPTTPGSAVPGVELDRWLFRNCFGLESDFAFPTCIIPELAGSPV